MMSARWAVASLRHRKLRTGLTALAIGLATAMAAITVSFQRGYETAVERGIEQLGYHLLVTGKGCPHEAATLLLRGGTIPMYIDEQVRRSIVGDPAVEDATAFLMQSVHTPETSSTQLYVGVDDRFLGLRPGAELQRGTWFTSPQADEAILGYSVAEYRRLELGDRIEVLGGELTVRAVLDQLGTQDDGTVFLPLAVAQSLFERRDQLTGIGLKLRAPEQAAATVERLYDIPSVQVVRMSQVQTTILRVFAGVRALLRSFVLMCVVLTLTGVLNDAVTLAHERTPEMGVLRAVGCSTGRLLQLLLAELLACGGLGVATGLLLAFTLDGAATWFIRTRLSYVPAGTDLTLTPGVAIACAASMLGLYVVAGLIPAWRCTRIAPRAAMRGSTCH